MNEKTPTFDEQTRAAIASVRAATSTFYPLHSTQELAEYVAKCDDTRDMCVEGAIEAGATRTDGGYIGYKKDGIWYDNTHEVAPLDQPPVKDRGITQ